MADVTDKSNEENEVRFDKIIPEEFNNLRSSMIEAFKKRWPDDKSIENIPKIPVATNKKTSIKIEPKDLIDLVNWVVSNNTKYYVNYSDKPSINPSSLKTGSVIYNEERKELLKRMRQQVYDIGWASCPGCSSLCKVDCTSGCYGCNGCTSCTGCNSSCGGCTGCYGCGMGCWDCKGCRGCGGCASCNYACTSGCHGCNKTCALTCSDECSNSCKGSCGAACTTSDRIGTPVMN